MNKLTKDAVLEITTGSETFRAKVLDVQYSGLTGSLVRMDGSDRPHSLLSKEWHDRSARGWILDEREDVQVRAVE